MKEQWIKYALVNSVSCSVVFGAFLEQKVNLFSASDGATKAICFSMIAAVCALITYYFWRNRFKFKRTKPQAR